MDRRTRTKEGFIAGPNIRVNERIRAREVRVIDDNGTQLGIMSPIEALKVARQQNLDLVEVSPTAMPPVCKIMDYGKYVYQQSKRAHEARKHQRTIVVKVVKFRPVTDEHDYEFKKNHILRFLQEGDKVKAVIHFKGREIAHAEIGRKMMARLIQDLAEVGTVEFQPRIEGSDLNAVFAPKK